MKFKIRETAPPQEKEQVVEISMEIDSDGDVCIKVGDRPMLWIHKRGDLLINDGEEEAFERMGFTMSGGRIKIYGED